MCSQRQKTSEYTTASWAKSQWCVSGSEWCVLIRGAFTAAGDGVWLAAWLLVPQLVVGEGGAVLALDGSLPHHQGKIIIFFGGGVTRCLHTPSFGIGTSTRPSRKEKMSSINARTNRSILSGLSFPAYIHRRCLKKGLRCKRSDGRMGENG